MNLFAQFVWAGASAGLLTCCCLGAAEPQHPAEKFFGAPEPKKASKASPLTPEEEQATFALPHGFQIELVASESEGMGKFVAVAWDLQGRMWSMTALEYPVDANENPAVANALYASAARDKVLVWDTPFAPGPQKPRVFAEGLAIPLGVLPYKNGVYVQHGPDIVFLSDTDRDGKADKREVILSGFGVQDSHLFPHQFTRAPGNWIWMAQGAFNYGKVKTTKGAEQQFDRTRMARFRYDGSEFDITSQGPCNIWGLVINGEGESFIQEANDYGYPVMPFHAYANYPGCSDALFKSYAPDFPGTAPDFRMGGTGLSGLALSDVPSSGPPPASATSGNQSLRTSAAAKSGWPAAYADVMYVANPITRQIQAIKMHRNGPRYRLQKLPDFVQSSDEMFRPVAIDLGPDGCLYIVDWYNKIISHNEVPRNHPERDKKRGRIWRVKHQDQKLFPVPNFEKLSGNELLAKLGGDSRAQSHLAWQAITDRQLTELAPKLKTLSTDTTQPAARRIASLWALEGLRQVDPTVLKPMLGAVNRNVRREAVRAFGEAHLAPTGTLDALEPLANDPDPEVRAEVIRTISGLLERDSPGRSDPSSSAAPPGSKSLSSSVINVTRDTGVSQRSLALLVGMAKPSSAEPTAKSTQSGKTIKIGVAYEREFERYLVRLFLEKHPQTVAAFLDSEVAKSLPLENRLVATLALESQAAATQLAKILPSLSRPPNDEEILRLAQFLDAPGATDTLQGLLQKPALRAQTLESLLKIRNRLDSVKLTPLLETSARSLLAGDNAALELALRLASSFKLLGLEEPINSLLASDTLGLLTPSALRALGQMNSRHVQTLAKFAKHADSSTSDEAIRALAFSKREDSPRLLLELWPDLNAAQRRTTLDGLAGFKTGAETLVKGVRSGVVEKADLEAGTLDKLHTVLPDDTGLAALLQEMDALFRPVLRLNGQDDAWVESDLTLEGPFTIETWVKLDAGIDNNDGILGAPGALDMNFHDAKFRVWAGADLHDAIIAKKSLAADSWTHVAVTRDGIGRFRIYLNGELDNDQSKPALQKFEHCRIGWTAPNRGTAGWLTEYRVWNRARTADEIRAAFDRSFEDIGTAKVKKPALSSGATPEPENKPGPSHAGSGKGLEGLVYYFPGGGPWGKLHGRARVEKTSDFPSLLTTAEARAQDEKFAKFQALLDKPGDVAHGQELFTATCMQCHTVGGQGGQIGPVLSGAGAMGAAGLLRALLTPNAAMEAGYRVFRVQLRDGDVVDGLLVAQDKDAIILRRPNAEDQRIPQRQVKRAGYTKLSLMPEGQIEALKPEDVTDLFAYLKTLK